MQINLDQNRKLELEKIHKAAHDGRVRDRIKAVLLNCEGWSNRQIAQALRINEETVFTHLQDFINFEKIKPENGGSESKLNEIQTTELISYLEENILVSTVQIRDYIFFQYNIEYAVQGLHNWLCRNNFSYKKPKECPAKADKIAQENFIKYYEELKNDAEKNDESVLFIDSVHPTMATKVSYGWIRKGTEKIIKTTASRTRINISGALELKEMKVIHNEFETINAEATVSFLARVRSNYNSAKKLHIILDNSGYHRSLAVKEFCEKQKIKLHFLPPYSPNLNPIERLWKVMNERSRNNQFFTSAGEFRERINGFFAEIIPNITDELRGRIADNFRAVGSVSSV